MAANCNTFKYSYIKLKKLYLESEINGVMITCSQYSAD